MRIIPSQSSPQTTIIFKFAGFLTAPREVAAVKTATKNFSNGKPSVSERQKSVEFMATIVSS